MKILSVVSCCFALVGAAQASGGAKVSLRGRVDLAPKAKTTFLVDGTNAVLTSRSIDLSAYVGEQVLIEGDWDGAATKPSVDVRSILVVRQTFSIGPRRSVGGEVGFAALGDPGEPVFLAASFQRAFLPIPDMGTLLLDPTGMVLLGANRMDATGRYEVAVPIPPDPGLVGLDVFGQGAILDGGIQPFFTNPDWMTIEK